ncbi:YcfL family protein [Edwardsiella piscicida]|uniref:YcfL family protein n=1 Tax=Edwardsiella piscicida TaxID=1263550 RepID=UPI00370DD15E
MAGNRSWAMLALLTPLWLVGCAAPSRIPINAEQRLVMEPGLLAAGVTATAPQITAQGSGRTAQAQVSYGDGEGGATLPLHYRFYWYDARGLEIAPAPAPARLTLQSGVRVRLTSFSRDPQARQVRLYLYY